ncbi:MAG: hypothetical protein HY259_07725, partial [Chloroflexi bacterium]|nr:hypothetical protein [Chloroflexota bacterium]
MSDPKARSWNNARIADLLIQIGQMLDVLGENSFKVNAYRRAADAIQHLDQDVRAVWQGGDAASPEPVEGASGVKNLRTIAGVGEAIASKLDELLRTGEMGYYRELSGQVPAGVLDIPKV